MINFKNLTLEDKDIIYRYINKVNFKTGEYSFSNLWLWKSLYNTQYAIIKDALIIKKIDVDDTIFFMAPIGYTNDNLMDIIDILTDYSLSHGFKLIFKEVEESFLKDITDMSHSINNICEDINNFDYIYLSEKLVSLSGKNLHSKKNHYNYFVQNINYTTKEISNNDDVINDCIDFTTTWCNNKDEVSPYIIHEKIGVIDSLKHFNDLNLHGIAVYVDNKICGFTFGENIKNEMALILIEKARPDIKGLYPFINKTLIEKYFTSVPIINRQEDMGIEGLKKAKMSYHPFKLEKKYLVAL